MTDGIDGAPGQPDPETNTSRQRRRVFFTTESLLVSVAIAVAAGVMYYFPRLVVPTQFWILAALPGVIGLLNYFIYTLPRYLARVEVLRSRYEVSARLGATTDDAVSTRRETWPSFAAYLWSSVLLTTVLGVPAVLANIRADGNAVSTIGGFGFSRDGDGLNGIIYAALGAYVALTVRMIGRINSNALSARFLTVSALRIAMAMLIGLAAGEFDLFEAVDGGGPRQALYFLVGMFTNWAIQALKRRARQLFQTEEQGCTALPVCLVEGVNEQTGDYLEEMGIWDVQHIATADPAELTERTLYPVNRVLDWIDQAVLISYLRNDISAARSLGIRGAIDFAVIYSWSRHGSEDPLALAAESTLSALAQKLGTTREAVTLLANSFANDATVQKLYALWQQRTPYELLSGARTMRES